MITPALNSAATLDETLASVREQHYPGSLEHIVVDGGSTDATLELVRESGLRHVSEPDRGLTHALNKGIAMAREPIVGSLNSDDTYLPGALDRVGRAFAGDPDVKWVTGRCRIVGARGQEIRRGVNAYKNLFLAHHSFGLHLVHNYVSAPATFVSRDELRAVGGYDERFAYSADYDLWLKLGQRSAPFVLDHELATFRMDGESLSLTGFERQFEEHARNASEHGEGHRAAVALNRVASRAIVLAYRTRRRLDG